MRFETFPAAQKGLEPDHPYRHPITKLNDNLNALLVTIRKHINKQSNIVIPMKKEEDPDLFKKFVAVMIPRIASLLKKFLNQKNFRITILKFVEIYWTRMLAVQFISSKNERNFEIALLLNLSRSFLESLESMERSISCLKEDISVISKELLDKYDQSIVTFVGEFLRNVVIPSPLFQRALSKVAHECGLQEHNEEMKKTFQVIEPLYLEKSDFEGMVGIGNTIYISCTNFIMEMNKGRARVLNLMLHEGMHLALRKVCKNFLKITPPSITSGMELQIKSSTCLQQHDDSEPLKYLEGGTRLEYHLWGDYDIEVESHHETVLEPKNWQRESPLFEDEVKKGQVKRTTRNFWCSGLFMLKKYKYR